MTMNQYISSIDLNDLIGDELELASTIPAVMTEGELAQFWGVSPTLIRQPSREGIVVRCGKGRFDVVASTRLYLERLRTRAVGRPAGENGDELKAERLRLVRAQAEKEELRVASTRGELLPAVDVARQWASTLRDVRSNLLAVASRCGASMPHLTASDVASIERELRAALEGLADDA